jgi:hypothetical protein
VVVVIEVVVVVVVAELVVVVYVDDRMCGGGCSIHVRSQFECVTVQVIHYLSDNFQVYGN